EFRRVLFRSATREVVQAEAVFEFAVVVLDAPADLSEPDEVGDRSLGRKGGSPGVGGLVRVGGPFDQQPAFRSGSVSVAGQAPVRRAHQSGREYAGHGAFG